jgi:hypothetical protein
MNPSATVDRSEALAVRQNMSPGGLRSASAQEFAFVVAAASPAIAPDRAYTQQEVNDVQRDWLANADATLTVDQVEFRRGLVDSRVLDGDGYGPQYRLGSPAAMVRGFAADLAGHDLVRVARAARVRDAAARDPRKSRWQHAQAGHG